MLMSSYYILRVHTYVSVLLSNQTFTNLTNRVLGPYCKLLTEFFPFRLMTVALSARAMNRMEKNKDPCLTAETGNINISPVC